MKPIIKFQTLILTLTTLIIFIGWINLTNLIIQFPWTSTIFAGFISIGIYRLLLNLIGFSIKRCWWIKKIFLGRYFLEGVWVGYFVGNEGKIRYFIEIFEQDFDELIIRGESYLDKGEYHGNWITEAAYINIKKGQLTYIYQTDAIKNTFINPGIAVFNFKRESQFKSPSQLTGFSSDLYNPNKLKAIEIKISDKTNYDVKVSLEKAKELYESTKNQF